MPCAPQASQDTQCSFLDTFPVDLKHFPVTSGTCSLSSPKNPPPPPPLLCIFSKAPCFNSTWAHPWGLYFSCILFKQELFFFFLPYPTWYWISRASESHLDHFPSLLPEQKMTSPLRLLPISSSPAPLCIDQVDFKYCLAILSVLHCQSTFPLSKKLFNIAPQISNTTSLSRH